ncbi:MAG: cyclase family protein [Kordiimonadaceae bacterium]|nr:cyclase family protein [Kordiimonadaceae bacterium]
MKEKRVSFDFEVEFSNGGGIQGQGFRLDITGDDIDDQALADYIIKDMRLLMVGEVRILNKKIIEEPHKRSVSNSTDETVSEKVKKYIDLSHTISNGLITYKGLPAPLICDHLSHVQSREMYDEGTEFQFGRINMVGNTGTYLDTPYHRYPEGHDLSKLLLDKVSNIPGVVVRIGDINKRAIDWTNFASINVKGMAVLVETGWSQNWGSDQYFEGHPYLTEKAAIYLRDHGATLVGIDSLNIDDSSTGSRPVHSVLLREEIPIVEHLCNLHLLPPSGFHFSAIPPKIEKIGTFPVRAHAII